MTNEFIFISKNYCKSNFRITEQVLPPDTYIAPNYTQTNGCSLSFIINCLCKLATNQNQNSCIPQ